MTLQDTIQALPDAEFRDLKAWIVTTETDRRAAQPAVEQAQAQLVEELWEQQPDLKPAYVGTVDPDTPTLDALLAQLRNGRSPPARPARTRPRHSCSMRARRGATAAEASTQPNPAPHSPAGKT